MVEMNGCNGVKANLGKISLETHTDANYGVCHRCGEGGTTRKIKSWMSIQYPPVAALK